MKELIKQYLDQGMSRRQLVSGLSALGMSTVAANRLRKISRLSVRVVGRPLRRLVRSAKSKAMVAPLFVAQLKAAGVEHIFFNPSTGDHSIFDALVDEPGIHLIKGIPRKAPWWLTATRAHPGEPASVVVANIGLPNAMTQMVNSWKDQIRAWSRSPRSIKMRWAATNFRKAIITN